MRRERVVEEPPEHRLARVEVAAREPAAEGRPGVPTLVRVSCSCGWERTCPYRGEDAAHAAHVAEVTGETDPA